MYLEHYGLSEAPFRITPNTGFFFAGANRGATLDALIYAITNDEGIVKISGEVGSGKTMLCRVLMERLPPHVVTVYLANPSLSREDILYAIAEELGVEIAAGRSNAVLRTLQEHLIQLYGEGRQVVVLIDEAHAMPTETLEEIRLLSNLESNSHMLLQLVLFGQPELNDVLARSDMRQLKERITHSFALEPLVRNDIDGYIDFRLRAAGYRGPKLFSNAAVKLIAGASLGLTRRINILADKSLLAAYAANTHQITPRHIRAAIRDAEFGNFRPAAIKLWGGPVGLAALLLLLPGWLVYHYETARPPPAAAQQIGNAAPQTTPPPPPVAAAEQPVAAAAPIPDMPLKSTKLAVLTPVLKPATDPAASLGAQTRARLDAAQYWLKTAPDEHWFIQLLGSDTGQAAAIESFVDRSIALLGAEQVRVYLVKARGIQRVGVIYGEYPTRAAALNAIQQLPPALRSLGAFPRMVKHLR
ncbi:MAG: AAA family ATPase [Betaproteobacteria bacterium]|nr:AAA family ATPase [Betaproteobacteria bacterium]